MVKETVKEERTEEELISSLMDKARAAQKLSLIHIYALFAAMCRAIRWCLPPRFILTREIYQKRLS